MIKLIIDMMGGDKGSSATKEGVRKFHSLHQDVDLVLVGKSEELKDMEGYTIIPATGVIKMESGVLEVLRQKDSSMVKAISSVMPLKADGIISCGSTGAFLSAATLVLKKIPGVLRPALTTSFPHLSNGNYVTILDVGASNQNSPEELAQFALMGSLYSKFVNHIDNPKVGLLSNGSEEGKGCPEGKAAYDLLKNDKKINFVGNIEGSNIIFGPSDVLVCDGYSGNVCLKTTEGTAKAMGALLKKAFMRNLASKIGYLLAKKGVASMKETMDPKKAGGALLVGVNAVAVKAHGNSDGEAFYNGIELVYALAKNHIVDEIKKGLTSNE
jgi:glycerol-3-phosphate acyltransferase PlsX